MENRVFRPRNDKETLFIIPSIIPLSEPPLSTVSEEGIINPDIFEGVDSQGNEKRWQIMSLTYPDQNKYIVPNPNELNKITELPDLQEFPNLKVLTVDDNNITQLPALPPSITTININNNRLTELPDLQEYSKLNWLSCKGNPITTVRSLSNFPTFTMLIDVKNLTLVSLIRIRDHFDTHLEQLSRNRPLYNEIKTRIAQIRAADISAYNEAATALTQKDVVDPETVLESPFQKQGTAITTNVLQFLQPDPKSKGVRRKSKKRKSKKRKSKRRKTKRRKY
jgi:hypothetical protein